MFKTPVVEFKVAGPDVPVVVKLVTTPDPPPVALIVIVVPDGVVTLHLSVTLVPATSSWIIGTNL